MTTEQRQFLDEFIADRSCFNHGGMTHICVTAALADIDRLTTERDVLKSGVEAVKDLIQNSYGVDGLHKNDDIATWVELRTGGRFEEWLMGFDRALDLLGATKQATASEPTESKAVAAPSEPEYQLTRKSLKAAEAELDNAKRILREAHNADRVAWEKECKNHPALWNGIQQAVPEKDQ